MARIDSSISFRVMKLANSPNCMKYIDLMTSNKMKREKSLSGVKEVLTRQYNLGQNVETLHPVGFPLLPLFNVVSLIQHVDHCGHLHGIQVATLKGGGIWLFTRIQINSMIWSVSQQVLYKIIVIYSMTSHFRVQIKAKTSANMGAYCTRREPVFNWFISLCDHNIESSAQFCQLPNEFRRIFFNKINRDRKFQINKKTSKFYFMSGHR